MRNKKYSSRVLWAVISGALVLFFVIDRVAGYGLLALADRSSIRFSQLYGGEIKTDILVVGSSRGVNSLYAPDTREKAGFSSYNLSWNGQSSEVSLAVIRDFLDNHNPPRMVLFEVTNINGKTELLQSLKMYAGRSPRIECLLKRDHKPLWFASQLSHLFRCNSEYFLRCLYYLRKDDQTWINTYQLTPEYFQVLVAKKDYELFRKPDSRRLNELVELAGELESRGIQIRFIVSPFLPEWIANNPGFYDWLGHIRDGLGEHRVFDYHNTLHGLEYFADAVHINRTGADLLLQTMIANGFFDSLKHDDAGVESHADYPEVEMR